MMFPEPTCKYKEFDYTIDNAVLMSELIERRLAIPFRRTKLELDEFVEGRIRVNGDLVTPQYKAQKGDTVTYLHLKDDERHQKHKFAVIYEDDDLVAVEKPAGLSVTPSLTSFFTSCVMMARKQFWIRPLSPVHRLDIDTSGVLLFGKHQEALRGLGAQFQNHQVDKRYRCLVNGQFPMDIANITGTIVRDEDSKIYSKYKLIEDGSEQTNTQIIACTQFDNMSELLVKPITGKSNQIRIHLAAKGHPIVGDKKYFEDESVYLNWYDHGTEDPRMPTKHHVLHATAMRLKHPMTGETLMLSSDNKAYEALRKKLVGE
jgi:RluA family pseudouridine synthase